MHKPALLKETINFLNPISGGFFIDGTVDGGGHSLEIIKKILPTGKLLAIDLDKNMLGKFEIKIKNLKLENNVIFINDNYANLPEILKNINLPLADGLLIDLGFSSEQIENSGKGFSFQKKEPLIMTYSENFEPLSAILKKIEEQELEKIIKKFGEERFAKRIAKAIKIEIKKNPEMTSFELGEVIKKAIPRRRGKIHPATRTFQALRIYANKELENLERILYVLPEILKSPFGRAVFISYHSLEDRLVKNIFRELEQKQIANILSKKAVKPTPEEINQNPRARSAKLRALELK